MNNTGAKIGMWIGIIAGVFGLGIGIIASVNPMLLAKWFMPLVENNGFQTFMEKYFIFLIIGFFVVVFGLAFRPLIKAGLENGRKKKKLMAIGAKTMATIISVQDTGITVNNAPFAKFIVEVKPGIRAGFSMTVSRLGIPRPGDPIEVYYDPSNPSDAIPS